MENIGEVSGEYEINAELNKALEVDAFCFPLDKNDYQVIEHFLHEIEAGKYE